MEIARRAKELAKEGDPFTIDRKTLLDDGQEDLAKIEIDCSFIEANHKLQKYTGYTKNLSYSCLAGINKNSLFLCQYDYLRGLVLNGFLKHVCNVGKLQNVKFYEFPQFRRIFHFFFFLKFI